MKLFNIIQGCDLQHFSKQEPVDTFPSSMSSVDDFSQRLIDVSTVDGVHQACTEICRSYGFDYFAIFTRFRQYDTRPLCFIMRQRDNAWTRYYEENKYIFVDPSIRISLLTASPYIWSINIYEHIRNSLARDEINVTERAIDFGITDVFNAPFKTADGDMGLIRFINASHALTGHCSLKREAPRICELFILSSYIFENLRRILKKEVPTYVLSDREKDVLLLTANGANPAKIGDALCISENTVCKHLCNIRGKLQTYSTTHAVTRAISSGLIYL